ncbi:MAG: hypothetical protein K2I96_23725 [Lachnospiraceae bacterium]|nr:hypothetical protein [Lachnospiraceae bacterium]
MRQRLILVFILLSTQLYGCSAQLPDKEAPIPSVVEISLDEENDTEQVEVPTEESRDEHSAISAETETNLEPVNAADTANSDEAPPSAAAEPEEGIVTTVSSYSAATGIPSAEVERYAAQVRQQFLKHDWTAVSAEISYPITIADVTYNNSTDFLNAAGSFEGNLDEAFFSALESEDCVEMFCNFEGIMIGENGQVWIAEVLDESFTSQGLKIIAVNGLLR